MGDLHSPTCPPPTGNLVSPWYLVPRCGDGTYLLELDGEPSGVPTR